MRRGVVFAFACSAIQLTIAEPAAAEPPTARRFVLGGGARYGARTGGRLDPWGFGGGVGYDFTFPFALYIGGGADYFAGDGHNSLLQLTLARIGYDLALGPVVFRPFVEEGFSVVVHSKNGLFVGGGGALVLPLGAIVLGTAAHYQTVGDVSHSRAVVLDLNVGFALPTRPPAGTNERQ